MKLIIYVSLPAVLYGKISFSKQQLFDLDLGGAKDSGRKGLYAQDTEYLDASTELGITTDAESETR